MDAATRQLVSDGVRRLTGRRPQSFRAIRHGHNNVVTAVRVGQATLLAKLYFHHPRDPRDRLGAEFRMLTFLAARGVPAVPRPIAADPARHLALYEFVRGRPLAAGDVTRRDVDALTDHLRTLRSLCGHPDARALPPAAEACFRLRDYGDHLRRRLARALPGGRPAPGLPPAVHRLLCEAIHPALDATEAALRKHAARARLDPDRRLPRTQRTLSPADHGFHNALRQGDGSLVFLDFEYAGWDDPAQMIVTTCLRPTLPIPAPWRTRYLRRMLTAPGSDPALATRVQLVYPLLMLKWVLILLNEFMPVDRERRAFARKGSTFDPARRLTLVRRRVAALQRVLQAPDAFLRAARTAGGG